MNTLYSKYFKRFFDIVLCSFALIVFGIPMLIIAGLIRINMGSPVLFKQTRIGKDEKKFTLLKFRSMKDATDANGIPLPDSERLTALGNFIRKTSIDELPSLINIIRGDMSIVGPRPLPWNYKPWFSKEERTRHQVRGGLTGLAQANGRNDLTWEEKFAYDIQYVQKVSLLLDISIILKTVVVVFKHKDIGERGAVRSQTDFHRERSGLNELELLEMEKAGTLPESLEEWEKSRNE